jgi:hypothetical protein
MNRWMGKVGTVGALALSCGVGCGGRPAEWDVAYRAGYDSAGNAPSTTNPYGSLQLRGMTGSVAMLDPALNQLLLFTSPDKLELETTRLPVGQDVVRFETSAERDKLFVLSRGVTPRYKDTDEEPQLIVFDGGVAPSELARYPLQDPYDQLAIDPLGKWLIVYGSKGLVSNPNELILVELPEGAGGKPKPTTSKTLNSYGGKPERFVFTDELTMPNGERRRLLIVQREKDLAVIDLADLDAPEITVGLPQSASGGFASPAAVVFHDAIAGESGSLLAVQLKNDSNVFILPIQPTENDDRSFSLGANLVDVGGTPSMLDFVRTSKDGGLRLAALVPSKKSAKLIEPSSSKVTDVALPVGFTKLRRITDDVSQASGQDVALLYGETTNTIAFWQLGVTVGTPYRSIDAYDLGINVGAVLDVPSPDLADRKILAGSGASPQFYVLDLSERKSFPLDTLTNLTLNLSPRGEQLWAFEPNTSGFARLTFDPLQPTSLYAERPITFVHDFATQVGETQRSALALHLLSNSSGRMTIAATLFDGDAPNTRTTQFYSDLELGGIK